MTDDRAGGAAVGTFSVTIEVGDASGSRYEALEALVNTGASYLAVPRTVLESLGVEVSEQRPFRLADGREADYDVAVASLRLDGRSFPVVAVFGDEGSGALLGAVALETFGLGVDPVGQRLVPLSGLLMAVSR